MEKYELLIRTMHAAGTARDKGLENIAEALDIWVKRISAMIDEEIRSNHKTSRDGVARRLPRRLSKRKC
ncbi:hypothetical protein [Roseovarius sp. MMSF_3305]|uniref:hypothetical protein n=1 Tax=Roseovarius sp. MMSF_3305 TaxID=3046697 RepID=UPI00273DBE87|nr:hypothetical protein [Roseovarius sp. MMSF_3305]